MLAEVIQADFEGHRIWRPDLKSLILAIKLVPLLGVCPGA